MKLTLSLEREHNRDGRYLNTGQIPSHGDKLRHVTVVPERLDDSDGKIRGQADNFVEIEIVSGMPTRLLDSD